MAVVALQTPSSGCCRSLADAQDGPRASRRAGSRTGSRVSSRTGSSVGWTTRSRTGQGRGKDGVEGPGRGTGSSVSSRGSNFELGNGVKDGSRYRAMGRAPGKDAGSRWPTKIQTSHIPVGTSTCPPEYELPGVITGAGSLTPYFVERHLVGMGRWASGGCQRMNLGSTRCRQATAGR